MAVFLNHSMYLFGINFSFADFLLILIILVSFFNRKLVIHKTTLLFFLVLSTFTLITATIITPIIFNAEISFVSVISNFIKLIVTYLYLILGFNLSKSNYFPTVCKWFSITALTIGIIGVVISVLGINIGFLFFAGYRYQGFMQDPNYYSILLLSSLPFFIRNEGISFIKKFLIGITVFMGVLVAGSKTGTIVFIIYMAYVIFTYFISSSSSKGSFVKKFFAFFTLVIIFPFIIQVFFIFIDKLSEFIPIIDRVSIIFKDFDNAINESGSSRESVYLTGIEIIKNSPIAGIGIGTYGSVAYALSGSYGIAHNTYIQLTAEWGIPLTIIFFSYLITYIVRAFKGKYSRFYINMVSRDILIILLLGSLAISLNNARIFWLVFGALIYSLSKKHEIESKQGGIK